MEQNQILALRAAGVIGRAAAYLLLKIESLTQALRDKINNGTIEVSGAILIHCFGVLATAGGIIKVMDSSVNKEVGISDFTNCKLGVDEAFAIDEVQLLYGGTAATYLPKARDYKVHRYVFAGTANFPVAILRGKFTLYANNQPIFELPVSEMVHEGREFAAGREVNQLEVCRIIPPGVQLTATIELPNGEVLGGADTEHFQLRFKGASTKAVAGT